MKNNNININKKYNGFTLVELIVVIVIIGILASVLMPALTKYIDKAKTSSALTEARSAWTLVNLEYEEGYDGFIQQNDECNGWYYDMVDDVCKYDVDNKYTVTYDKVKFEVIDYDISKSKNWDEIITASKDYTNYSLSDSPMGLNITYYQDIYSRGFSWMTNNSVAETKLYIVEGNEGESSNFSEGTLINGTSELITYTNGEGNKYSDISSSKYLYARYTTNTYENIDDITYYAHKAYITNLKPSTTYSYKLGGNNKYVYGVFRTEAKEINKITAIQLSDAQTLDPSSLNIWENTMAQAIETAGNSLDMVLYNGDQFDQRMFDSNDSGTDSSMSRILRYGLARDTVSNYVSTIPYMTSSGNHEPFAPYSHVLMNTIDYGNDNVLNDGEYWDGGYYSYSYGFAYFIVLNTNTMDKTQISWLTNELINAQSYKWIIVMMHIGCYATGDHSNGSSIQNLITSLTPLFSEYHVDLVLQAHDHTYNKTLPYLWDKQGYTTTYNNSEVVNFNVEKKNIEGISYDYNPNGTYYVTTGAAGHRVGSHECDDGIWADVDDSKLLSDSTCGLWNSTITNSQSWVEDKDKNKTFTLNTYKIEVGRITQYNRYDSYYASQGTILSDQIFNIGDYATGNVNAQMFGVLELTNNTLSYKFYTVSGNDVRLFDTLYVYKN